MHSGLDMPPTAPESVTNGSRSSTRYRDCRKLHLVGTGVTDQGLEQLNGLPMLGMAVCFDSPSITLWHWRLKSQLP